MATRQQESAHIARTATYTPAPRIAHTYQWDAEGRLVSVDGGSTESFVYNALGKMVRTSGPSSNWVLDNVYDAAGNMAQLFDAVNGWAVSYQLHVAGHVLRMAYNSGYDFYHVNALGSTTMQTDQTGTVNEDLLLYPWGQEWQQDTSSDWNVRFAGMRSRDGNTGLDLTLFRRYDSFLGRWLTPDRMGGDITDPQSLNRYAYVLNNPTTLTDPLGLAAGDDMTCVGFFAGNIPVDYCQPAGPYFPTNLTPPCSAMDGYGCGYNSPSSYGYGNGYSGGGGGGAGSTPKPAPAVTSINQRIGCAAQYGEEHSLASLLGVNHNVIGNALFGNTISDVANAYLFFANGSGSPAQTGAAFALNGPTLGIPVASANPGLRSMTGTAIETGVGSFLNGVRGVGTEPIELGLAGKVATPILPISEVTVGAIVSDLTVGKLALDGLIFAYGAYRGCAQ